MSRNKDGNVFVRGVVIPRAYIYSGARRPVQRGDYTMHEDDVRRVVSVLAGAPILRNHGSRIAPDDVEDVRRATADHPSMQVGYRQALNADALIETIGSIERAYVNDATGDVEIEASLPRAMLDGQTRSLSLDHLVHENGDIDVHGVACVGTPARAGSGITHAADTAAGPWRVVGPSLITRLTEDVSRQTLPGASRYMECAHAAVDTTAHVRARVCL